MPKQKQPKMYSSPIGDDVLERLRTLADRLVEIRDSAQEMIVELGQLSNDDLQRRVDNMRGGERLLCEARPISPPAPQEGCDCLVCSTARARAAKAATTT